jgi:hypothetical protein
LHTINSHGISDLFELYVSFLTTTKDNDDEKEIIIDYANDDHDEHNSDKDNYDNNNHSSDSGSGSSSDDSDTETADNTNTTINDELHGSTERKQNEESIVLRPRKTNRRIF